MTAPRSDFQALVGTGARHAAGESRLTCLTQEAGWFDRRGRRMTDGAAARTGAGVFAVVLMFRPPQR